MKTTLSDDVKQYFVITGNYWAFTLTDGALRMLVILYFHQLGYSPLNIAMLFLFYEIFGVLTNLFGGYLGAKIGLNKTMNIGLFLQIGAVAMLTVPNEYLSIVLVMFAQAMSGVAKDLNKMSAKSAIKLLVPADAQSTLFKWVALLTGSKNTLKGVGFFLGGLLLSLYGFQMSMVIMALALTFVWAFSLLLLKTDLGKKKHKPKFSELFSKSPNINKLSGARLFLFAARDVWFVVALPVYLVSEFNWTSSYVGAFIACWIIGYGAVQALAPVILSKSVNSQKHSLTNDTHNSNGAIKAARQWALYVAIVPFIMVVGYLLELDNQFVTIAGLIIFGLVFAVNSSLHSYLIVHFADSDGVSMDVGFYYMANAMGRLFGTALSGVVFQFWGFSTCLIISGVLLGLSYLLASQLEKMQLKTSALID